MCFSPLPSYQVSDSFVKVFPRDTAYIYYECNSCEWIAVPFSALDKFGAAPTNKTIPREWLTMLPCGKCLDCRLAYARDWANRCVVESLSYGYNWFFTVTYNNEHLPLIYKDDVTPSASLWKDDILAFIKAVRNHWQYKYEHTGIRFFLAGEYGDKSFRPHYHLIVFNLPLGKLDYYAKSPLGDVYYTCDELNKCWNKGYIVIGEMTSQSAAYTARYCLKKIKDGQSDVYSQLGIIPEYTNCSRRPGIGKVWYDKHKEQLFSQGFVSVSDGQKSLRVYPGRYFKRLYKSEHEAEYLKYQELQLYKATIKHDMELLQTDLNELEYDLVKKDNALARTKILFDRSVI